MSRKWLHTVDNTIVDEWLDRALQDRSSKIQPFVNEILLAVAQGRLVDPAPLQAQIQLLQEQIRQQQGLILEAVRAGTLPADRLPSPGTPPAAPSGPEPPSKRPPGGGGLKFTKG